MKLQKRAIAWGFGVSTAFVALHLLLSVSWLFGFQVLIPLLILFASVRAPSRPHALAIALLQTAAIVVPVALLLLSVPYIQGQIWAGIGVVILVGFTSVLFRARREPPPPKSEIDLALGFYVFVAARFPSWLVTMLVEMIRQS